MTAIEDINVLLDDAGEQIKIAGTLHDQALANSNARGRFRSRIKNVLENQRSALDYLAVEIAQRYGTPKGLIYYPLAQTQGDFSAEMERKMPGVAATRPDIADAIGKHQPHEHEWLRQLNQLTREQKHKRLTFQLVRSTYECRVTENSTGAWVAWSGLRLETGMIDSMGGTIEFRPNPNRKPASPQLFELGGPTGYLVFGVPLDPSTQQPFPSADLTVEVGPIELWFFTSPHLPVLAFLDQSLWSVRKAVDEIADVAAL